jgi:hypothetical protein
MSCTPPVVAPPPVLRPDWKILTWLAFTWSKPPDLDVCRVSSYIRRFCGTTDKTKHAWFWGTNQETITVILNAKSPNRSYRFWDPNQETRATGFDVKPGETVAIGFEAKPEKTVMILIPNHWQTVPVVLRLNHWQTVDLGFEAQQRNLHSSSPRARCRQHRAPPDLSIARPLSTRHVRPSLVLCTRSTTRVMILVAACHTAPITCTPRDKQTRFSNEIKNKSKITEMPRIRIQTLPSQWLITIKPRNCQLGFSYFIIILTQVCSYLSLF